MYTLYGIKGSGSAIVEAALVTMGLPHRLVDAASWQPGSGLDELSRINPLQQIPTLQLPDGSVLTESAAILIYLGLTEPASGLLPSDAAARAQVIRGLVFVVANCYAAISVIDYPARWCADADEATQLRIRQGTRARLHLHWDMFADTFAEPLAAGLTRDTPGALALMAAVVSRWSGARAHLLTARPEFHALLLRVDQHPRVAPVFERHWPR